MHEAAWTAMVVGQRQLAVYRWQLGVHRCPKGRQILVWGKCGWTWCDSCIRMPWQRLSGPEGSGGGSWKTSVIWDHRRVAMTRMGAAKTCRHRATVESSSGGIAPHAVAAHQQLVCGRGRKGV